MGVPSPETPGMPRPESCEWPPLPCTPFLPQLPTLCSAARALLGPRPVCQWEGAVVWQPPAPGSHLPGAGAGGKEPRVAWSWWPVLRGGGSGAPSTQSTGSPLASHRPTLGCDICAFPGGPSGRALLGAGVPFLPSLCGLGRKFKVLSPSLPPNPGVCLSAGSGSRVTARALLRPRGGQRRGEESGGWPPLCTCTCSVTLGKAVSSPVSGDHSVRCCRLPTRWARPGSGVSRAGEAGWL